MVPLHHLGLLTLVLSGFLSYNTGVPIFNLGNSLPGFGFDLMFLNQFLYWFIISRLSKINHGKVSPVLT